MGRATKQQIASRESYGQHLQQQIQREMGACSGHSAGITKQISKGSLSYGNMKTIKRLERVLALTKDKQNKKLERYGYRFEKQEKGMKKLKVKYGESDFYQSTILWDEDLEKEEKIVMRDYFIEFNKVGKKYGKDSQEYIEMGKTISNMEKQFNDNTIEHEKTFPEDKLSKSKRYLELQIKGD